MHPELHFGSWSLPTYFLIISIDFCLMLVWLRRRSRHRGLSVKLALDTAIIGTLAGFVAARLFHVFYEYPGFYLENPSYIFKLWEGGYVILPGLFVGAMVCIWWLRFLKQPLGVWLDVFAPVLALGYSLGRWACFFQGCCYGRTTESILGVHLEVLQQQGESFARYPTQIFASVGEIFLFVGLMLLERGFHRKLVAGQLFAFWMLGHGTNRIIMELFRDDPRGPLLVGLGVSFWFALGFVFLGGFLGFTKSGRSWTLGTKSSDFPSIPDHKN
jgi:phosphatidylglycerol:prolipoprotein diacylglycerol transferase